MEKIQTDLKPYQIEINSFKIIDSEVPEPRPFKGHEWLIIRRMIHTTADFELLSLTNFHPQAIMNGLEALKRGCLLITDTEMARMGISKWRLERLGCRIECHIGADEVKETAQKEQRTRAAAAVDLVRNRLNNSIYVIGNAPTALLRLLQLIKEQQIRPALIVGMPVGFVNAAESKKILMEQRDIPFISIKGRKGGSALAATVINQLAEIVLNERDKS